MRKRLFSIFLIAQVLVSGCGKDSGTSGGDSGGTTPFEGPVVLTVATCNVLKPSGRCTQMSMDTQTVYRALGKSVSATNADIIGFNELDETLVSGGRYSIRAVTTLNDMAWKLEWPNHMTSANSQLSYTYANGFAYNSTKIRLEDSGYVWLSKEEDAWYIKSASAYQHSGSPARTCIWARMTHIASGKEFWLFVTHLPTSSQGGATNMAGVVNRFAAQKAGNAPAILTGDMNNAPGKSAYLVLTSYWTDGSTSRDGTLSGSSSKYHYTVEEYAGGRSDRRIDHIMARGCTPSDYRTIVETYLYEGETWCPSDHLPVVATITIE